MPVPQPLQPSRRGRRHRGFTLFEALFASVLLAMAVAAIGQAISSAVKQGDFALHVQQGSALLDEMIERILALPYVSANGYNRSEQPGQVADDAGNLYPADYQVFSRTATVTAGSQTVSGLGSIQGLNITVTVTDNAHNAWTARRFIPQPVP